MSKKQKTDCMQKLIYILEFFVYEFSSFSFFQDETTLPNFFVFFHNFIGINSQ
jgi:hypothetical protein